MRSVDFHADTGDARFAQEIACVIEVSGPAPDENGVIVQGFRVEASQRDSGVPPRLVDGWIPRSFAPNTTRVTARRKGMPCEYHSQDPNIECGGGDRMTRFVEGASLEDCIGSQANYGRTIARLT